MVHVLAAGGRLDLLVDVDDSLHVDLTGWAVPIYKGDPGVESIFWKRGLCTRRAKTK